MFSTLHLGQSSSLPDLPGLAHLSFGRCAKNWDAFDFKAEQAQNLFVVFLLKQVPVVRRLSKSFQRLPQPAGIK
jgi:hypothetical protein